MARNEVVLRVVAQKGASVDQVINEVQSSFGRLGGPIGKLFSGVSEKSGELRELGVAVGAVSFVVGRLGRELVARASEFEQFRAKLETVTHSVSAAREAMAYAVQFAAVTPFEVKGVVDATVQLGIFGVQARETLPMVANLAGGMGREIAETAHAFGGAWAGSQTAITQLRHSFGVSIFDLKKWGAEVTNQGEVLIHTQNQLDRFRRALTAIVNTRFAGAMERQLNTLKGAASNLQDAVTRFMVTLGERLIPLLTALAKGATAAVERFEKLPASLKDAAVLGGAAALALGSVATVIGLAVVEGTKLALALDAVAGAYLKSAAAARLNAVAVASAGRAQGIAAGIALQAAGGAGLGSLAATAVAPAAGRLSLTAAGTAATAATGPFANLKAVLGSATGAVRAFAAANPLAAGAMVLGTAATAAASAAFSEYYDHLKRVNEAIEDQAHRTIELGQHARTALKFVEELEKHRPGGKPGGQDPGASPGAAPAGADREQIPVWNSLANRLRRAMSSSTAAEQVAALHKIGIQSADDFQKEVNRIKPLRDEIEAERSLLDKVQPGMRQQLGRDLKMDPVSRALLAHQERHGFRNRTVRSTDVLTGNALDAEIARRGAGNVSVDLKEVARQAQLVKEDQDRLFSLFEGKGTVSVERFNEVLGRTQMKFDKLVVPARYFASVQKAFASFQALGDEIRRQDKANKEYFNFLDKEGTSTGQREKAARLVEDSNKLQKLLSDAGFKPGSNGQIGSETLRQALKSDLFTADQKEQIGHLLEVRGQHREALEKANKLQAEEIEKRVALMKRHREELREQGRLTATAEKQIQSDIDAARAPNKIAAKSIVGDRKHDLEEYLNNAKGMLQRLKAANLITAAEEAAGYARIIAGLRKFQKDVLPGLRQRSPEEARGLGAFVEKAISETGTDQAAATKADRQKQLADLKHFIDKTIEDAHAGKRLSTEGQLALVEEARRRYEDRGRAIGLKGAGQTPEQQAESFMERQEALQARIARVRDDKRLTQEQRDQRVAALSQQQSGLAEYQKTLREYELEKKRLKKQIHDEEMQQLQEVNSARLQGLQGSLEELKHQQTLGKRVTDDVVKNLQQQLALKLRNIELAAQKELEVERLTAQQRRQILEKTHLAQLDALRAQRTALRQLLDQMSGGAKAVEDKLGRIQQLAQQQPDQSGQQTFAGFPVMTKAGTELEARLAARKREAEQDDAARIAAIAKKGRAMGRDEMETLRDLLERSFGLILTSNTDIANKPAMEGKEYVTLGQVSDRFGGGGAPKSEQAQVAAEISKLDTQIANLEKSISDGVTTEIANLGTTVVGLSQAIEGLSSAIAGMKDGKQQPEGTAGTRAEQPRPTEADLNSPDLFNGATVGGGAGVVGGAGGSLEGVPGAVYYGGGKWGIPIQNRLDVGPPLPQKIAVPGGVRAESPRDAGEPPRAGTRLSAVSVPVNVHNTTDPNVVGAAVASAMRSAQNNPNSRGFLGVV